MPIHWEYGLVVDRPIDEIWAEVMDLFNAPRLGRREGLLAIRQTSPGPMGLGSTYSERRIILGFETRLTGRVTEWDPPYALTTTMEGRPFGSLVDRLTLKTVVNGTEVVNTDDFELRAPLKWLWPIIGPFLIRRRRAAFRELKATLEARPRAQSG